MKIAIRIILVLVILALIPVFFANRLARKYAVQIIEDQTGFLVDVEDINVGVFNSVVQVKKFVLTNPPGFPYPEAMAVHELFIHYDVWSLLSKEVHIKEFRIDVSRIVLVKTQKEKSNLEVLAGMDKPRADQQGGAPTPEQPPTSPQSPGQPEGKRKDKPSRSIKIDELNVKLGEMEVRQYQKTGEEPSIVNVQVGMDRTLYGVTNLQEAVTQLSSDVIINTSINLLQPKIEEIRQNPDEAMDKLKRKLDKFKDKYLK